MHVTGSRDANTDDAGPGPVPGTPGPTCSSDPVRWATGRSRAEWFALLDAAGAGEGDHRAIVARLERDHPEVTGWWRQSIAVGYARHRASGEPEDEAGEDAAGEIESDAAGGPPAR